MTGIQKLFTAMAFGAFSGMVTGYETLSEEQKKALHKRAAERMLNKALKAELKEPYDDEEIMYIEKNLGMEISSK